jgi:hypothetical protein
VRDGAEAVVEREGEPAPTRIVKESDGPDRMDESAADRVAALGLNQRRGLAVAHCKVDERVHAPASMKMGGGPVRHVLAHIRLMYRHIDRQVPANMTDVRAHQSMCRLGPRCLQTLSSSASRTNVPAHRGFRGPFGMRRHTGNVPGHRSRGYLLARRFQCPGASPMFRQTGLFAPCRHMSTGMPAHRPICRHVC